MSDNTNNQQNLNTNNPDCEQEVDLAEILQVRRDKLAALVAAGKNPSSEEPTSELQSPSFPGLVFAGMPEKTVSRIPILELS